jgi:hypothetical protein
MKPRYHPSISAAGLTLALTVTISAQGPAKFGEVQKANAVTLREYTWKSRTEIKVKGESKNIKLEQVRYDMNGQLQKKPLGGTPPSSGQPAQSGGGLRGRAKQKVVENKKEEFVELMTNLGKLVASYGHLQPEQIQAFVKHATTTQGVGDLQGTLGIRGQNVLQPGDSLTIWVDPSTMFMRRAEIATGLEKKPVSAVADYQTLSGGPNYMARAVLQYPDKAVELTVDNYDYQRVGR